MPRHHQSHPDPASLEREFQAIWNKLDHIAGERVIERVTTPPVEPVDPGPTIIASGVGDLRIINTPIEAEIPAGGPGLELVLQNVGLYSSGNVVVFYRLDVSILSFAGVAFDLFVYHSGANVVCPISFPTGSPTRPKSGLYQIGWLTSLGAPGHYQLLPDPGQAFDWAAFTRFDRWDRQTYRNTLGYPVVPDGVEGDWKTLNLHILLWRREEVESSTCLRMQLQTRWALFTRYLYGDQCTLF